MDMILVNNCQQSIGLFYLIACPHEMKSVLSMVATFHAGSLIHHHDFVDQYYEPQNVEHILEIDAYVLQYL